MVWDITAPAGSALRSTGASSIRTWRTDVQTALQSEGIFPGADTSNPVYYRNVKYNTTANRPASSSNNIGRWYFNTTTNTLQRDNGTSWDDISVPSNLIPSGTKMSFYNNSAPTGWTQDAANNDKFLRVTTGAGGGTGGTDSIQSPPTHNHTGITGNPTTSLAHTHPVPTSQVVASIGGGQTVIANFTSVGTSGTLAHTHPITSATAFTPRYIDFIICSKN